MRVDLRGTHRLTIHIKTGEGDDGTRGDDIVEVEVEVEVEGKAVTLGMKGLLGVQFFQQEGWNGGHDRPLSRDMNLREQ
jgi:hypothetical protein